MQKAGFLKYKSGLLHGHKMKIYWLVSFPAGIWSSTFGIRPDEGKDFCVPQTVHTSSGVHPVSPMYRGSCPGLQQPGREVDHSRSSSAEIKNKWSYTSTPSIGLSSIRRTRTLLFFTLYLPNTSETLPHGPIGTVVMFRELHVFMTVSLQCVWMLSFSVCDMVAHYAIF